MDIVIGGPAPVSDTPSRRKGVPPAAKKVVRKDRRKNRRDRRRSVREGIIVTLSVKNDRRVLRDRRKVTD